MKNSLTPILIISIFLFFGLTQELPSQNKFERPKIISGIGHNYVVKIVTGTQKDKHNKELGVGTYSSLVNIYNPNPVVVIIQKELVLTRPLEQNGLSTNIPLGKDTLMSNHAMKVNPMEYLDDYSNQDYFEGFLSVRSTKEVEVSTVYTASHFGSNKIVALDIERINQNEKPVEIIGEIGKPDLIPVPFMDGNFVQFFSNPYTSLPRYMRVKVRNIGTKSCGSFKVTLSAYSEGRVADAYDTGWLSGLKVDEEKAIIFYKLRDTNITVPQSNNKFQVFVDIDNIIDESNENNNSTITRLSVLGKYIEGYH